MRKLLLFPLLLFVGLAANIELNAQGEANIWYFGYGCGIDFNNGLPVADTTGDMYAWEGCSTICDANGSILFYTNGDTVWNRNHVPMPNGTGLHGGNTSSQAALIIKKPLSNSIYYIFTTPNQTGWTGLGSYMTYSEVDLNLQSGLGDVTSIKNLMMLDTATEHLSAVRAYDGSSVWVMAHEWNSNNFMAYFVSSAGVSLSPVVSSIGLTPTASFTNWTSVGAIKFSPDGDMMAVSWTMLDTVQLYDFDNLTGTLSNLRSLYFYNCYGIEFSPFGNYLYVSKAGGSAGAELRQFDITLPAQWQIQNSAFLFPLANPNNFFGMLQLGPDGRIYVDRWGYSHLGVIMQPDQSGLACNHIDSAIYLQGFRTRGGLPGFNCSYFSDHNQNWESIIELSDGQTNIAWPNPFSSSFTLKNPDPSDLLSSVTLYDATGNEVYHLTERSVDYYITNAVLPKGVYVYQLYSESGRLYTGTMIRN
jgi:hypothetical protein